MRAINFPADQLSNLAMALRCTDAVKFAKYLPMTDESEECLEKIKNTISLIEQHSKINDQQNSNLK
jgi:hypothetical protein